VHLGEAPDPLRREHADALLLRVLRAWQTSPRTSLTAFSP
jgi:hypothetical protein